MGIPAQSRWWVFTLVAIGVLMAISALALDHADVVWDAAKPHCPHCRHEVADYSHRCADCGGEFDWVVPSEDESPISSMSLSARESEWVRDRVQALGIETASQRVALETGLSPAAAEAYLRNVGRGDCGWCGGTRRDLATPESAAAEDCPACFGTGDCVECGGDRRIAIGRQSAARALERYRRRMADLTASHIPDEMRRAEARQLAQTFLASHEGTLEAGHIEFWLYVADAPGDPRGRRGSVVRHGRARLDQVLGALGQDG